MAAPGHLSAERLESGPMQDLYASTFRLPHAGFESAAEQVARWAHRTEGEAPDVLAERQGSRANGRYKFTWQQHQDEEAQAVEVLLRHADDRLPGVEWRTAVDLSTDGEHATFTLRLAREARELLLAPAPITLRRPGLVPDLLRLFDCSVGDVPLRAVPQPLQADDISAAVADLLTHPGRRLPVVVLATPPGHEHPLVDPVRVASELAGLAHVCWLTGHLAWRRLSEELDDRTAIVPPGGARLYWPGFGQPDDRLRHPFWTRAVLQKEGDDWWRTRFSTLSRLSVVSVPRDARTRELRSRELERRRAELEAAAGAGGEAMVNGFIEEFDALEAERDDLRGQVQELRDTVVQQEQELEGHRANYAAGVGAPPSTTSQPEITARDLEPSSWDEFAEALPLLTGDSFALTEHALSQVPGNPYPDPARMWDHLCRLSEAAAEWRRLDGKIGQRLKDWVQTGYGIEISLQDNNLKGADSFTYEGVELSNIPHVKVDDFVDPGRCGRIHFDSDRDNLRFVVDHIGLHR